MRGSPCDQGADTPKPQVLGQGKPEEAGVGGRKVSMRCQMWAGGSLGLGGRADVLSKLRVGQAGRLSTFSPKPLKGRRVFSMKRDK